MNRKLVRSGLCAALIGSGFLAAPGAAPAAEIDAARSLVSVTFRQMGTPIEGRFTRLRGNVDYDPARPEAATASIEIDVGSFDLGDAEFNQVAAQGDWLDVAHHAKASFVSSMVKASGATRLAVSGTLSIKGHSASVTLPLELKTADGRVTFEGRLPIRRLAFGLGEGEWRDTSVVADDVLIGVRIVVPAAGGSRRQ